MRNYQELFTRASTRKVVKNISWLFFDKILRMGMGLFVGVWVARYLGPEGFGKLSFALSYISLFSVIANLGLQGVVVRDLVRYPATADKLIANGLFLQLLGGILAAVIAVITIHLLESDDYLMRVAVSILAVTLIFKSSDMIKYKFESLVLSKYVVWVENIVFLFASICKVALIIGGASLILFVWISFTELLLVFVCLFAVYFSVYGNLFKSKPTIKACSDLLKEAWPLILSGMAVIVYMKIDQVMLGVMLNDRAVGIYSTAVRVSEIWYFVVIGVVASVFPSIIRSKEISEKLFKKRMQYLYDSLTTLSVVVAFLISITAESIIGTVFGDAYLEGGSILSIHVWVAVFVFQAKISSKWFFVVDRQVLILERSLIGAAANIILNIVLIPKLGAIGAAYSTLVAYVLLAFVYDLFRVETREMFFMKARSFNMIRGIKNILSANI